MRVRWWVCVGCGDYWPQEDEPERNLEGGVLCAECARRLREEGRL